MNTDSVNQDTYKKLQGSILPGSGVVHNFEESAGDDSGLSYRIDWRRNISFVVRENHSIGWFYIEKDSQPVSNIFHYKKIDDRILGIMQNLVNEAETGKYDSKRTLDERIILIREQRGLTSYMNKTKWNELFSGLNSIAGLTIRYKTLLDNDEPEDFWDLSGDEYLSYMKPSLIEWLEIKDTVIHSEYAGRLIDPKITYFSVFEEIEKILKMHNINYAYDESRGAFTVYGYK